MDEPKEFSFNSLPCSAKSLHCEQPCPKAKSTAINAIASKNNPFFMPQKYEQTLRMRVLFPDLTNWC